MVKVGNNTQYKVSYQLHAQNDISCLGLILD